ncbi:MAG: transposase [Ktedonobacteraceae bacterium]
MRPDERLLQRLETIPGIKRRLAEVILAEIGADMSRFPSARHLASWAGMCPGNNESAGKRLSGKTRKGSPWLRSALVEAAHAAIHCKDSYLAAKSQRLALRRGGKKATMKEMFLEMVPPPLCSQAVRALVKRNQCGISV